MKTAGGKIGFGFFEGMKYRESTDSFTEFRNYKNSLPRKTIISHIKNLPVGIAGFPVKDIFTGEDDGVGAIFSDGPFTFPVQFLRYYETYDIGIPPEYEDYLINVVGLK
ncbi:MAG: hypothetical protein J5449_04420 [Oscillospiraceae bacterium]|nr:hypothetical protein [Oscillospiraceae bacterium]